MLRQPFTVGIRVPFICLYFACCLLAAEPLMADDIRVMSFNIRYGSANDGENQWELRKSLVSETISRFQPDLLGVQETLNYQAEFLKQQLNGYSYFGRSRMNTPNEHCGIFFNNERFTWLAGGHFWLSETPEVPESKSWDSSLPRMATWVLLHDTEGATTSPILFVNTHFDHRGRRARLESARVIRDHIQRLRRISNQPWVIVAGDFNTPEASEPYGAFLEGSNLVDTFRVFQPERQSNEGTFNGFRGVMSGGRIDWILCDNALSVKEAAIVRTSFEGRYPSDHFPVTAICTVPAARPD